MKRIFLLTIAFLTLCTIAFTQQLQSPDKNFNLQFSLLQDGTPTYSLTYKNKEVVKPGKLGFFLKNDEKSLLDSFTITDTKYVSNDDTWTPGWGELKEIRNHYNEIAFTLTQQGTERQMIIRFRLFDDGDRKSTRLNSSHVKISYAVFCL